MAGIPPCSTRIKPGRLLNPRNPQLRNQVILLVWDGTGDAENGCLGFGHPPVARATPEAGKELGVVTGCRGAIMSVVAVSRGVQYHSWMLAQRLSNGAKQAAKEKLAGTKGPMAGGSKAVAFRKASTAPTEGDSGAAASG